MPAQGTEGVQQAAGDDGGQAFDGVEPRRSERALLRGHAIGGQHQQRQHRHRLAEHLQQVERVEIAADPLRRQQAAAHARHRQHAQPDGQHPAAVHRTDVAQRRCERQGNELRHGHQHHQRAGLRRAIALDLRQVRRRNRAHARQHDQHAGQGHQGKAQVASRQHAQLEERQRLGPFVVQEQHQQQQATAEQPADQRRVEPAPAVTQRQAKHGAADGGQTEQHATPVELLEAFQAQRILRQAPADTEHGQRRGQDDLPERPFGPQPRQWRAEVGAEGGSQGVAGQAIDLDTRRQKPQRHAHQHGRQRPRSKALQRAQQHQAVQVGSEGLQQPQHGEQANRGQGEAAQGKGRRQPRRESHGRDRGGAVDRQQPGALVGTDAHGATDVGQGDLGHRFIQAGTQHRQQHPEQPDHHAQAEGRLHRRGRRRGGGERGRGRGQGTHEQTSPATNYWLEPV
ncbi:hypothetical protein D3C79_500480 [compost metagenome]